MVYRTDKNNISNFYSAKSVIFKYPISYGIIIHRRSYYPPRAYFGSHSLSGLQVDDEMKTENNVGDLSQLPSDDKQYELNLEKKSVKVCDECKLSKSVQFFYKKNKSSDNTCKNCRCVQRKNRYNASSNCKIDNTKKEALSGIRRPSVANGSKPNLLTPEDIQKIAEAMLILEGWQVDVDTQRDLSNSNLIPSSKQE